MTRRCPDCPPLTQAVCRHAFGKYWRIKSAKGKGCERPADAIAEAWRRAGWEPQTVVAIETERGIML